MSLGQLVNPRFCLDSEVDPGENNENNGWESSLQIVGKSAGIHRSLNLARKAANTKTTVLLLGESGTGKEVFARTIHSWSERADKPFIAINCVGLSKELLESELFGHEKGAFTGAYRLKKGKMELAQRGTVFLDEIGDITPELQTKLLRFLQEREFERVGGTHRIAVDIRIIAATNRDIERAVQQGRFREDLFYRLNVLPITIPPLRERKEDISPLARFFLGRFCLETKRSFTGIAQEAEERLMAYDWPGNVRELANTIERAIVLGCEPLITTADLPPQFATTELRRRSDIPSYREAIENSKRELIQRTLAVTGGNRAAAAKILGLRRTYLFKLIKSLAIE
jgi:transcriptional regulator with PAS, ATPase and Fis domain